MSGALEKSLAILEYLSDYPEGAPLVTIATDLNLLRSSCHRTLQELIGYGYVRAMPQAGQYALTTKMASLGLSFLSKSGVTDIAQPLLRRLAEQTEELVRLAVVDGNRLTLVAKVQGARSGLLYDPDMGIDLNLSCSAGGQAWLMTLEEEQAIEVVMQQGLGKAEDFGPNAPTSLRALLKDLERHRKRGYSTTVDVYAPGMSSMAAPVRRKGEETTGTIVIAGPSHRLTEARMQQFGPLLLAAASEMALTGNASPLLKSANLGTWGNRMARGHKRIRRND